MSTRVTRTTPLPTHRRRSPRARSQATSSRGETSAPAPAGLVAEQFAIDGEEFVAFTWESPRDVSVLTPAERAVFDLLLHGASNVAIARARSSAARTVANQVAAIFHKLGVGSRYELIARFGRLASP